MKTNHLAFPEKCKTGRLNGSVVRVILTGILVVLSICLPGQNIYRDYFTYLTPNSPITEGTQVTSIVSTGNGYVSIGVAKGLYSSICTGLSLNFKKEDGTLLRHNRLFNCDSIVISGGASGLMLNDSILFLNFVGLQTGSMPATHELYLVRYNVNSGALVSTSVIAGQIESGGYGVTQNSTKTIRMNNGTISVMCASYSGVNMLNFDNSLQLQISKKVAILPTPTSYFELNTSTSSMVETESGHLFLSLNYTQLNSSPVFIISSGNAIVDLDSAFNISFAKIYDFTGSVEYLGCSNLLYKNQSLVGSIGIAGAPYPNRNAGMYKIDPQNGNILSAKTIQAMNDPFLQADSNNYSSSLGVQNILGNNYTFFCVVQNLTTKGQYLLWSVDSALNLIDSKKSSFVKIDNIYADNFAAGCLSNAGNEFILNQYSNGYGLDTVNDSGIASELFARFGNNLQSNCSNTYSTFDSLYTITNYFSVDTVFNTVATTQSLTITSSSLVLMDSIPLMYMAQRALCTIAPPPNPTGMKKEINVNQINVSPNPASCCLKIENEIDGVKSLKLQIINTLGQIVAEDHLSVVEKSSHIDYSLPLTSSGIYYIKLITDKEQVFIHKLVIAK